MTSIGPRQDLLCALCGHAAYQEHHVLHRSLGGEDDEHNLVRLCSECHAKLHPEKFGGPRIAISKDSLGLLVVNKDTGEVLLDQPERPAWFHMQKWLAQFRRMPRHARIAAQVYFRFLPNDALIEAYQVLEELDSELWIARAKLLRVAHLRICWGQRKEKWPAILQEFGVQKSQGYDLMRAEALWEAKYSDQSEILPPAPVVLLAEKLPDPKAGVDRWVARKIDNPRYSIAQWKEENKAGQTVDDPEVEYCTGGCALCAKQFGPHPKQKVTADYTIAETTERVLREIEEGQKRAGTPF